MERLDALIRSISDFKTWNHADKIKFFAWYCQAEQGKEEFSSADIRKCYEALDIAQPSARRCCERDPPGEPTDKKSCGDGEGQKTDGAEYRTLIVFLSFGFGLLFLEQRHRGRKYGWKG